MDSLILPGEVEVLAEAVDSAEVVDTLLSFDPVITDVGLSDENCAD